MPGPAGGGLALGGIKMADQFSHEPFKEKWKTCQDEVCGARFPENPNNPKDPYCPICSPVYRRAQETAKYKPAKTD